MLEGLEGRICCDDWRFTATAELRTWTHDSFYLHAVGSVSVGHGPCNPFFVVSTVTPELLKKRMFDLAVRTLAFVRALPRGMVEFRLGGQLIDSSSSTPAQYRAACRAESTKEPDSSVNVRQGG